MKPSYEIILTDETGRKEHVVIFPFRNIQPRIKVDMIQTGAGDNSIIVQDTKTSYCITINNDKPGQDVIYIPKVKARKIIEMLLQMALEERLNKEYESK